MKIRALVVDDAALIRKLVSEAVQSDPEIEVVGTAANGRIGLAKIPQVNPDVVTLDIEMPEMDGLQMLRAIRQTYPNLPVIVFSTRTQRGAVETLDALALGASDYVPKPSNLQGSQGGIDYIREQLIPRIKQLCGRPPVIKTRPAVAPVERYAASPRRRVEVVVIGVSTGGPNALADLIPALPGTFPVPILIVQHMPVMFTRLLAERLNGRAEIRVAEAAGGEPLRPGHAWLAPGDHHMVVDGNQLSARILLNTGPLENSCRPAADVLFRSAASLFGAGTLGVVLTGMGQDGLRGCEAIKEAGGQVLVQDEASSIVWGMPGFVAQAGLADQILPLCDVAAEIIRRVQRSGEGCQR